MLSKFCPEENVEQFCKMPTNFVGECFALSMLFWLHLLKWQATHRCLFLGETEIEDEFDAYSNTIWIDMPMCSRVMHVLKQVKLHLPNSFLRCHVTCFSSSTRSSTRACSPLRARSRPPPHGSARSGGFPWTEQSTQPSHTSASSASSSSKSQSPRSRRSTGWTASSPSSSPPTASGMLEQHFSFGTWRGQIQTEEDSRNATSHFGMPTT